MKVAIVGSRNVPSCAKAQILSALPPDTTLIISGGARGIDRYAAQIAKEQHIPLREYLPEYDRYGRGAPLKRNDLIIDDADLVLAFWDGRSRGTGYVITQCKKRKKPYAVYPLEGE